MTMLRHTDGERSMDAAWEGSENKPLHIRENEIPATPGTPVLFGCLGMQAAAVTLFAIGVAMQGGLVTGLLVIAGILTFAASLLILGGLFTVAPNQAKVLQL